MAVWMEPIVAADCTKGQTCWSLSVGRSVGVLCTFGSSPPLSRLSLSLTLFTSLSGSPSVSVFVLLFLCQDSSSKMSFLFTWNLTTNYPKVQKNFILEKSRRFYQVVLRQRDFIFNSERIFSFQKLNNGHYKEKKIPKLLLFQTFKSITLSLERKCGQIKFKIGLYFLNAISYKNLIGHAI